MTDITPEAVEKIAQAVERHQRKKQAAYERNPRYHPPDHRYALVPQMLRSLAAERDALRAQLAELQAQVQTARDALEWYAEQGADCRKIGARGDVARAKLDRDGGHKARVTIAAMIQPTEPRPDAAK